MADAVPFRVDFVVGGTQKGGTSALAHFLGQHPEICLPKRKEAHFFDAAEFPSAAPPEALAQSYRALYPDELTGRLRGDATPVYMYLPEVPERIWRHNPAMKWILLLRDPVERAVSHYRMERAQGNEKLSFEDALDAEPARLRRDRVNRQWNSSVRLHSYVDRGHYTRQIRRVRRWFGQDAILVLTSGELRHRHEETLRRVYAFLGLDDPGFFPPAETVFPALPTGEISARTRARLRRAFRWEFLRLRWRLGAGRSRILGSDLD